MATATGDLFCSTHCHKRATHVPLLTSSPHPALLTRRPAQVRQGGISHSSLTRWAHPHWWHKATKKGWHEGVTRGQARVTARGAWTPTRMRKIWTDKLHRYAPTKPGWTLFEHQSASIKINKHQSALISINININRHSSASIIINLHSILKKKNYIFSTINAKFFQKLQNL